MRSNKKLLLLSAVTIGLLSTQVEPPIVNASSKTMKSENVVKENISKENGTTYHIVRSGETVFSISKKYGISEDALNVWNKLSNNVIKVNQVLSVDGVNVYNNITKETNRFENTQQFINRVAPIALEMAKKYELYPSVMIAQAILETGSGKSELAEYANNYYGIKGTYKGNSIYKLSPEEVKGTIIQQSSRFRVYPSLRASVEDNARRLRLGPNTDSEDKPWSLNHYKGTWVENAFTYRDATQALVDAGYATDSSYATKLNNHIHNYNLIQYDKQLYSFVNEREKYVAEAPARNFVKMVRALPNISEIQLMSVRELSAVEKQLAEARNVFNQLRDADKKDATVAGWEEFLSQKEEMAHFVTTNSSTVKPVNPKPEESTLNSAGNQFVQMAHALPSVSDIQQMNESDLTGMQSALIEVRDFYKGLSSTDKANANVVLWEGYLLQKEEAFKAVLLTSEEFIMAANGLPYVSQIASMSQDQLIELQVEIVRVRLLYDALSSTDKAKPSVILWEGYLSDKEIALNASLPNDSEIVESETDSSGDDRDLLGEAFVKVISEMPNISTIETMNRNQLRTLQTEMAEARSLYEKLPVAIQKLSEVNRWEGFLTEKEAYLTALLSSGEAFIDSVKALPLISEMKSMNIHQLQSLEEKMVEIRSLFNDLPGSTQNQSEISRWVGFLGEKQEKANILLNLDQMFIDRVYNMPNVSQIEKMNPNEFAKLKRDFSKARSLYETMKIAQKDDRDVVTWIGYLTAKETAVKNIEQAANQFVKTAQALPSVAQIKRMTDRQIEQLAVRSNAVRKAYNNLAPVAHNFKDVATWEGYLTEKENAMFGLSTVRLTKTFEYGVDSGDTFNSIAEKFQVDLNRLIARNSHLNPSNLKAGDTVYVQNAIARPMDHTQARDGKHVVYLDAGHGGWETGAHAFGTSEKDLNLVIARKLTKRLEAMGYTVINVRTNDDYVSLTNRSKNANGTNADIFVSLHHNALNGSVQGIETFYYKNARTINPTINKQYHNDGARLANSVYLSHLIQDNLVSATGANYRRVAGQSFAVLRETSLPATLVEYGFMDNRQEFNKLTNGSYQNKMVNATADAIDTYFKTLYK